jgi:hypothetical protein
MQFLLSLHWCWAIKNKVLMRAPAYNKKKNPDNTLDLNGWDARIKIAQNMEHVDDYIPLIPGVLALGGPIRKKLLKAFEDHIVKVLVHRRQTEDADDGIVCTIVDVTDNTVDKTWWQKDEDFPERGIEICRQFKLEARRAGDDDLDPVKLMEVARFVKMKCQGGKRLVYVCGYECTRVACVVALLAWVLYKNERVRDPVDFLKKDVLRNVTHITRDFPASDAYVAVIRQLTTQHRKSVEAAFPGLKAVKRQKK